jgi:hypothetical protein
VSVDGSPTFHLREVRPRDFYLAQILRDREEGYIKLVTRLLLNDEVLDQVTSTTYRTAIKWVVETLLEETIMTVENWLELGWHLNKQRWDGAIDWLEMQPMSKIQQMIHVVEKNAPKK